MRLTSRGRTLAVVGVSMTLSGLIFGIVELEMVGISLAFLLLFVAVGVVLRSARVETERVIDPRIVQVGKEVTVEIRVKRVSARTPLVGVDSIPKWVGPPVRLTIEPSSGIRRARYRFKPRMRGVHRIGPLNLVQTDSLGAVQRQVDSVGSAPLTVLPDFDPIATLPGGVQRLGIVKHSPRLGQGEDFYAMREYIPGDDLRKIHWSTTARLGKLVIRENELLSEPTCIIVLDTQASKHAGEGPDSSFEAAVSAAASIADLAMRQRTRLRIVTPDGSLLRSERAPHLDVMTALAGVNPTNHTIARSLSAVGRTFANVLVVITPGLTADESSSLTVAAAPASGGAVVNVVASSWSDQPTRGRATATALGLPLVQIHKGDRFTELWEKGVAPRGFVRS